MPDGHGHALGRRGRALLDFERDWAAHQGRKEQAIAQAFGISPARYYQLLAAVVDDPAAQIYDPLTVRRVRRRRDRRRNRRPDAGLGGRGRS